MTDERFTMHRERHWGVVVAVLVFLVLVETAGLHVALSRWWWPAAWIATLSTAPIAVWLVLDLRALTRRGAVIADDALLVAVGLRWRMRIPWADLSSASAIESRPPRAPELLDAGVLTPNVLLELSAPTAAHRLGKERRVRRVALTIDRRAEFLAAVAARAALST
jgi:hypothetical protein